MDSKYVVIEFRKGTTDDDTDAPVEAVPSCWVDTAEETCRWPRDKSLMRMREAIARCEAPSDSWDTCKYAKVLFQGDDLQIARQAASEFEYLSSNAHEDEPPAKRKRFPSTRLTDMVSGDSIDSSDSEEDSVTNDEPSEKKSASHTEFPTPNDNSVLHGARKLETSALHFLVSENSPTPVLSKILSTLEQIKSLMKENNKLLKAAFSNTQASPESVRFVNHALAGMLGKLPAESLNEFQEWEEFLSDAENFADSVKHFAGRVGGDASTGCRRILATVLSNKLAVSYNWGGKRPKLPFKNSLTANLILCAVKENIPTSTEDTRKVEDVMKDWLKHATFRNNYASKK